MGKQMISVSESEENQFIAQFTAAALTGILSRLELEIGNDVQIIPGTTASDDRTPELLAEGASRIGIAVAHKFMEDCGIEVVHRS